MIIDYSVARPSMATLKAAGVTAAGRYIGWDSVPGFASINKNITRAEASALIKAGIGIFLAFEYAVNAVIHGHDQGLRDGALASRQLHDLGAPPGMTVYFAVDFDIGDYAPASHDPKAKLGPAADYFRGVHDTKPAYQVGVYGGYYAVSRCLDARLAVMGWQTVAWSGGQWDPRAVLRQEVAQPLPGTDLDEVRLHTPSGADFGQWPRPGGSRQSPGHGHNADGKTSLRDWAHPKMKVHEAVHAMALARPHGYGPMQAAYVGAGDWDALMPPGMDLP